MKNLIIALAIGVSPLAFAHDEGHGPKLSDTGKFGGVVSGVVLKSEASKGSKAALVYKAELARGQDGTVRVYVYDDKMSQLDIKDFDAKATAVLLVEGKGKNKGKFKESKFDLAKEDKFYVGKMPKPEGKPYNIDVTLKDKSRELLSAFDNLD